jgi:glycosyltransferase involved in cell wall biosynthesis
MKPRTVLITAAQVPFQRGGAEWHVEALHRELVARGFRAEVVQVPFQWSPRTEALRSCLSWRLLDFTRAGGILVDLVIATRFPSYAARHPNKVLWLFHPFRQAYDLHEAGIDGFPDDEEGRRLRAEFIALDTRLLKECRRVFTTSRNNAERLRRFNGVESEVLRLPLLDAGSWRAEAYEPYVLSVGRLEALKRPELLVRAAAGLAEGMRAVVVGEGSQADALKALARTLGVAERLDFRGWVDEPTLKALYARCGAVFYAPFDEDYGLVTLEAFHSRKPVVTTTDSGGVLEFVRDGETGRVVRPEPEALATVIARLLGQPEEARRLGETGFASVKAFGWDEVIARLTGQSVERSVV